ncbi:hypothetical protein SVIOM74S_06989 [Streptomyces violarus]
MRYPGRDRAHQGGRAEQREHGPDAAQSQQGDHRARRDAGQGERQYGGVQHRAAWITGGGGYDVDRLDLCAPGGGLLCHGLLEELCDSRSGRGRGEQFGPLRRDHDGAVDAAVLDGVPGGGLVGVAVDLEGALVPLQLPLHLGRRGGRSGHAQRQVAGCCTGGRPGEGPQREGC